MKKLLYLLLASCFLSVPAQAMNGIQLPVTSVSASSYTALTTDTVIAVDSTSNAVSITMYANPVNGAVVEIYDAKLQAAAHNITINPAATPSSQTVNRGASLVMNVSGERVRLIYNLTTNNWIGASSLPGILANTDIFVGNSSGMPAPVAVSGDCALSNAGAITCTKTNNVSFATSATTDTTNATNIITGTLPHSCKVVSGGGAGWTNTGLGVNTEENLVSVPLPALGVNDIIVVWSVWTRSGTGGDSVSFQARLSSTSCTPQTACSSGTAYFSRSDTVTTASTVNNLLAISNRNATNSQVGFPGAGSIPFGNSTSPVITSAIQTNSSSFINLDSTTITSSADSAKLEWYMVLDCTP